MNQGFLVVELKSSLRKYNSSHHDLDNRYEISVWQMTTDIVSGYHNPVLSSFMTYHMIVDKGNTKQLHVGQQRPLLPEHLCPPLLLSGVRVVQSSVFCVVFYWPLSVFLSTFFLIFSPLNYSFWFPLWHRQTFINCNWKDRWPCVRHWLALYNNIILV